MFKKWLLRNVALMLSLVMFITSSAQTTYGFITAVTEPLINIFVPTEISDESFLSITGEKTLSGRDWKEGDSFDFVLEQKVSEEEWVEISRKTLEYSAENPDFSKFDFSDVEFLFGEAGVYEFRVREEKGPDANIIYDDTVYNIAVTTEIIAGAAVITAVSLNGETIEPENGCFGVKTNFENTYAAPDAAKIEIAVKKEFSAESDEHGLGGFEFVLKETTPGREAEYKEVSDEAGFGVFGLYFEEAGEYTFELFETAGNEDVMTYDGTIYVFTVAVTEENGALTAKIKERETDFFVFTNGYEAPKGEIKVDISISVEVKNDRTPPTDLSNFSFVIYGMGFVRTGQVVEMNSEGKVYLPFVFTEDEVGTYTYTISQIIPEENSPDRIEELSYDDSTHVITIEIIKNEDGSLRAVLWLDGEETTKANAHFINRFPGESEIKIPVKITKIVENAAESAAPEAAFDFVISDSPEGGNILASGSVLLAEGELSAETTIELVLTKEHIGSNTYYLREVNGGKEGWVYDEDPLVFKTVVINEGNDEAPDIVLESLVFEDEDVMEIEAEFTNIYMGEDKESAKVPLTIKKKVINYGEEEIGPEQFEFIIENLTEETSQRVRTNENGDFATYLEFGEEDIGKTFRYRVKEVKGRKTGVTYDDSVYDISVSVTGTGDEIKTSLAVNGFMTNRLEFTFENIYKPSSVPSEDSVTVPIIIEKSILNIGEKEIGPSGFEFVIKEVTDGEEDGYFEKKTTDIEGRAVFNLVFDRSDIDEVYEYEVYEIAGEIEGMKYDTTVYKVEIGVYAGGENGIGIAVYVNEKEVTEAVLEFENKYDFKDEGNPETGFSDISESVAAMIFSGALFVALVLTDKRFKFSK